jgi:hypothetical protein
MKTTQKVAYVEFVLVPYTTNNPHTICAGEQWRNDGEAQRRLFCSALNAVT